MSGLIPRSEDGGPCCGVPTGVCVWAQCVATCTCRCGAPTEVAGAALARFSDDGDAGEPVLATGRQRKACTPAAKVVSSAEAGAMFRC